MKWSFILFLPALVTLLWALATLVIKRRPTRAQIILSLMLILEAFAMVVISVFFRGKAGSLFIYDFLFVSTAMFCVPMYYVGICSLTEPRGATLEQRRTFILPILYVLGLTIGAFWLGPRRYELMCHAIREGAAGWVAGDMAWNFMYFWDHILFPVAMLVSCLVLMLMAAHKSRVFSERFNSFYAKDINVPQIGHRQLLVYTCIFLVFAVATVLVIDLRPYYYKYWLIVISILMTMMQFVIGRYIFRLNYDARYVAAYVKQKTEK